MGKIKSIKVNEKQIDKLLKTHTWISREDIRPEGVYNSYVELDDGRLLVFWNEWDNKLQKFSDKKRKGWTMESVDYYILHMKPHQISPYAGQHVAAPHPHYFREWDSTGATYIRDLLTVMPVRPALLDFSKASLLAIDKVIKRKKLPDNVLEDSIFLPAIIGYCGVYLEREQDRQILIAYSAQDDVYEPYYVDDDREEFLYVPFYEEASENSRKFSLDEVVEVNFFKGPSLRLHHHFFP